MAEAATTRALISVSDKTGLADFCRGLVELGIELVSTGGTRRFLADEHRLPVLDVSEYTGFPEIMDGRVKTLHPKVHGAILGRPAKAEDRAVMDEHGIVPFSLVVCNLYPFESTVAKPDVSLAEAIEQIDIGGPSMIRSAAKNHLYVAVVTNSGQYDRVLTALRDGELDEPFRRELALTAFQRTAEYDAAIVEYLQTTVEANVSAEQADEALFPSTFQPTFRLKNTLRYGENPHQAAAFYVESSPHPATLAAAEQLHGKELSYNNLLDCDAALNLVREFEAPACAVIKHNNPCGCAIGAGPEDAFEKAYAGDPVSAFGSIIAFNCELDATAAEKMSEPNRFIEAIIAPAFSSEAREILTTRPKWKNSVRLLACPALTQERPASLDFRKITGGLLVQEKNDRPDPQAEWQVVTERQPSDEERRDLEFSWRVCKHVRSNAIVLAGDGAIVGVGAGQMSRLDSSFIAAHKAGERAQGSVLASDAFFPFRDGVDEAAQAGVTAVIQPGGSRNDEQVVDACNEHGIAMIFTGRRHFQH